MQSISEPTSAQPPAINQAPARTRLGHLIGTVYRQWRRQVDVSFKGLGLTDATRMPLLVLYVNATAMRQKDIAEALCLDASSLVRVLAQLREMELVDWSCDPADRRTKCVALTTKGQHVASLILQKSIDIEQAILADLSEEELAVTREALNKIARRFESLQD